MTSLGKGALIFFGGVLFGTAGIKALSSRDAKKHIPIAPLQR